MSKTDIARLAGQGARAKSQAANPNANAPDLPLRVHWAVAREDRPEYATLPLAIRVVEVGPKPGWPRMGDWYRFACGRHWIAVPANFRATKLVDFQGEGDWPYEWCEACQTNPPGRRYEREWAKTPADAQRGV